MTDTQETEPRYPDYVEYPGDPDKYARLTDNFVTIVGSGGDVVWIPNDPQGREFLQETVDKMKNEW